MVSWCGAVVFVVWWCLCGVVVSLWCGDVGVLVVFFLVGGIILVWCVLWCGGVCCVVVAVSCRA